MTTELNLKVAASLDDAYQGETGGMVLTGTGIEHRANTAANNRMWGGHRFILPNPIPIGSTIITAYIKLYLYSATYDDVNGNFHFQKAAAPPEFAGDSLNITSRPRTDLSTPWIASGLGTSWKQSPSLVPTLQELVNAYEVSTLVAIFRPNQDNNYWLVSYSFNKGAAYGAELYIEYGPPPVVAPTVQTSPADEITPTTAKLHGTLIDDGGEPCDVRFYYGIKPDYQAETEWQPGKESEATFEAELSELLPATTFVFKAVAKNSAGETEGDELEFTTEAAPPGAPPPLKLLITHPAIKDVKVYKGGELEESYENLSNLDEERIEDTVEIPIAPPATLEVITLSGVAHVFEIRE